MYNVVLQSSTGEQLLELAGEYVVGELGGDLAFLLLAALMLLGAVLMLLAAVGLVRLPDLPTRMHASTKAGSLGAGLIMLAAAVAMPEPGVWARSIAVVAFLLLTSPVAAHVIGRAGYFVGVPLWEGTIKDDLEDRYNYKRHTLESGRLADREIEGWDQEFEEEPPAYDPLVDDEPPRESIVRHPVEEAADDRRIRPTGAEEVTDGDAGAERAEGQTHEIPPPDDRREPESDVGDYAGESPESPAPGTDEVADTEARRAPDDESAGDDEGTRDDGEKSGDEESDDEDSADEEPSDGEEYSGDEESDDEDSGDDKKKDDDVKEPVSGGV